METGGEAFFNSTGQFDHLNLWLKGGANLNIIGVGSQTYYKTVFDIPGNYLNVLEKSRFAVNGLLSGDNLLDVGKLSGDMPGIVDSLSRSFDKNPLTIATYEDDGNGYDFNFSLDLNAALGFGGGFSLGFDTKDYDDVSFVKKYTALYANNQSYLFVLFELSVTEFERF